MGLFEQFPYSNFHQLNLDWIINELKKLENHAVLSVNGQTGNVILYQSENVVFPEVESSTWRMVRVSDGHTVGVMFQNGLMYLMYDNTADRVYTVNNPPTFPVTSVNGDTGAVILYKDAGVRFPDVDDGYMNIRRQIDSQGTPAIVGLQVDKNKAQRINGTNRYDMYDSQNPPPYPVTSVNGSTGAVVLAIPFDEPLTDSVWMASEPSADHVAGIGRETIDGTVELYMDTSTGQDAKAYLHFVSSDEQYTFLKQILTTDDIPSGSGVVSFNGLTGVVTAYGNTLPIKSGAVETIKDYIDHFVDCMVYQVNGDTASATVPANAYVFITNNTHGLTDGFYQNTSGSAFPVSGGTADNTVFTSISTEGLVNKAFNDLYDSLVKTDIYTTITNLDDLPINSIGRIGLDASISPTGVLALFNYVCYGIEDYQSVLLSSTYSDREWMNTKHGTAWKGWREIGSADQNFRTVTYTYTVGYGQRVNTNLKTLIDADLPAGATFAGIVGFQSGDASAVISAAFYANNNYSLCINNIGGSTISDKTATIYYKYV